MLDKEIWDALFGKGPKTHPREPQKVVNHGPYKLTKGVAPTCPHCGSKSELVTGLEIYPHLPQLHGKRFWLCAPCDAYVGCHSAGYIIGPGIRSDGTIALGRLANAELRKAKSMVHKILDPIWQTNIVNKRSKAYEMLATGMGIPVDECHVGMFTLDQCYQAMDVCRAILKQHDSPVLQDLNPEDLMLKKKWHPKKDPS